ncbi:hypothetical protein [Sediminibacterium ginsengisoli]|uniref:Uncharacterized protein n=1 Tax=Sediminibacterium ginsengisoli TaxID=413434 RepID=A0A1T4K1J8_9BACT|nr:hypothetical protein [Sediminibacterium ginsengisoli]SJZ36342.1 hypothetical protein SAMN04488132_101393 [Sediminibacterium ginsengisoli]
MLPSLPIYVPLFFGLTALVTLLLFFLTIRNAATQTVRQNAGRITACLLLWLAIQAVLTFKNVYNTGTDALPPKIVLFGVMPPIATIIILFATKKGRTFIDSLPLVNLTCLHIVRIPVEIVLFWLFLNKAIPGLMTFEGRNFDIIAGITAPLIAWLGFKKAKITRKGILVWNLLCLALLLNIVVNAFLSTPSPLQKFAFDQPNIGILYFPFSWLPTFIVPVVLFAHLVSVRRLLYRDDKKSKN